MAIITSSPRRYKFSITRFEAYEGQNRIHVNPSSEDTCPLAQSELVAPSQSIEFQITVATPTTIEKEEKNKTLEQERIKTSFRPSRITFLRNRLGQKWRWLMQTREASTVAGGPKGRNDDSSVSPQGIHGHKISKRFGEILAGREELSPRKKYSPSQRSVAVEPKEQVTPHEGVVEVPVEEEFTKFGIQENRSPRIVLREVVAVMERLSVVDPRVRKVQIEARRRRAVVVRRRKLSMMLKRDGLRG